MENVTVIGVHTTLCVCEIDVTIYEILNFNSFNSIKKALLRKITARSLTEKGVAFPFVKFCTTNILLTAIGNWLSIFFDRN